jgi:hypothetical protein
VSLSGRQESALPVGQTRIAVGTLLHREPLASPDAVSRRVATHRGRKVPPIRLFRRHLARRNSGWHKFPAMGSVGYVSSNFDASAFDRSTGCFPLLWIRGCLDG